MQIGIGIDTGGTYTDAVIYDFENKSVLGSAKALTTKDNLSKGILEALDALPEQLVKSATVVSLSTTLATNACVEDRGGSAKLIFFGADKSTIDRFGGKYGLPPSGEIYMLEGYTKFSGEMEREPDWDKFVAGLDESFARVDGVGIIEMNAMKNSGAVEKKAKELFAQRYDIPVVCGHELFSELNCLRRGASTLLNAKLFPVIREFLSAIKTAMEKRAINAAVVIVRSDGSLMSEEFSRLRPVETLLCGPAASVLGGAELTGEPNSIVVDMGGTTTDIALVRGGAPVKALNGVSIGKWKTFVDGLYLKTLGLGGDSAVHYNGTGMLLEDYRVVPLCIAAQSYPQIIENLKGLSQAEDTFFAYPYEHYMPVKDISASERHTDEERRFCEALKDGPLIKAAAAAAVGKDIYSLNVSRLVKEGTVQVCGLTPTDAMHIKGDFNGYSKEASSLAAGYVARTLGLTAGQLCDKLYDEVERRIYVNIVKALLENRYKEYLENGISSDVERFINAGYDQAKSGKTDGLLSMDFRTDLALVGIGAPIHIFLPEVAKLLGTRAVLPKHHEVANAVGAIVGNVYASCEAEIKPVYNAEGIASYKVFGYSGTRDFSRLRDAEAFAVRDAEEGARSEARKRGATGDMAVTCALEKHEGRAKDFMVYLGTTARATAVGAIAF